MLEDKNACRDVVASDAYAVGMVSERSEVPVLESFTSLGSALWSFRVVWLSHGERCAW